MDRHVTVLKNTACTRIEILPAAITAISQISPWGDAVRLFTARAHDTGGPAQLLQQFLCVLLGSCKVK